MTTPFKTPLLALVSTVSVLALCEAALAVDPQAFADRLEAHYSTPDFTVTLDEGVEEGANLVYPGITFSTSSGGGAEPTHFETELTFTNVAQSEDGGFTAESLTLSDIEVSQDGGQLTLADIRLTDIVLPGGEAEAEAMLRTVGGLFTGAMSFSQDGTEVVSFESFSAENSFDPDQMSESLASIASSMEVTGLSVDLSSLEAEATAFISALGIEALAGTITGETNWSLADGRMDISSFAIALEELGTLDLAFDMSGYTPALLDQMTAQQEAAMDPSMTQQQREAAQAAAGLAMLSQLSLNGFSVSFADDSLTENLIAFMASQQNMAPEAMREGLKMLAVQSVQALGSPELTAMVTDAVGAFLDDPQSLTITARPGQPINFMQLAAVAAQPAALVEALGLSITANE